MKLIKIVLAVCLSATLLVGCLPPQATGFKEEDMNFIQLKPPTKGQEIAEVTTSLGTIKFMLFEKEAPNTVAHFKKLVEDGFYNNQTVLLQKGQGSFITGTIDGDVNKSKLLTDKQKPIQIEVDTNLWHFSGAVSTLGYEESSVTKRMLSDSRIFFMGNVEATEEVIKQLTEKKYPNRVIEEYKKAGGSPQFTGSHTVFGQVYEGLDVVDKITHLKADEETAKPTDGFTIEKVELSTYSE